MYDGSPRSEDMQSGKTTSMSSPSIKSESDAHSPGQPPINSPMSISALTAGLVDDYDGGNMQLGSLGTMDDPAWPYADEDLEVILIRKFLSTLYLIILFCFQQVADLPYVLREMVDLSGPTAAATAGIRTGGPRHRLKNRINNKGSLVSNPLSNIPEINSHRNFGLGDLNRKITDLKMEPGTTPPPLPSPIAKNCMTDLGNQRPPTGPSPSCTNTMMTNAYLNPAQIRRDSNNSTTSSSYYSMRSADISRRSSQASQQSSISTMRPISYYNSSFYDPISPGSSRRSSSMSTATNTGGHSLPPPPSSHLISTHLQRFNPSMMGNAATGSSRHSIPNNLGSGNYYQQQQMMLGQVDRRLSEPVAANQNNVAGARFGPGFGGPSRPSSAAPRTSTVTSGAAAKLPSPPTGKLHPNQEVVLDEVEEGEMVENKLVIPDEMLQYLNQVADQEQKTTVPQGMSTPNSVTAPTDTAGACGWNQNENSPQGFSGNPMQPPKQQPASFNKPQTNLNNVLMSPQSQYSNDDCSLMSNVMSPQTPQHPMMSPMMPESAVAPLTPSNYGPQAQQPTQVQCQLQNFNANMNNNKTTNTSNRNGGFPQNQQPPQLRQIACSNLIGYYHRTDQSAHHCCLAMMMQGSLHINQPSGEAGISANNSQQYKNPFSVNFNSNFQCQRGQQQQQQQPQPATTSTQPSNVEIQCGDISQSQMSPAVAASLVATPNPAQATHQQAPKPMESSLQTPPLPSTPVGFGEPPAAAPAPTVAATNGTQTAMGSETYQRTLEYVQNCQNWVESAADIVSSSTHPSTAAAAAAAAATGAASSNLVINDMSTSLSSYFEEDRYLQMIQ